MGDVAGGLTDLAAVLGNTAKGCQIASLANEMSKDVIGPDGKIIRKGSPEFAGVRDPDVLKLLFEKQRLDNDTLKTHELSLLYAARAGNLDSKTANNSNSATPTGDDYGVTGKSIEAQRARAIAEQKFMGEVAAVVDLTV